MKWMLAFAIAVVFTALPIVVSAQTPAPTPPPSELQIERKQRKAVVLPKPSPEQIRADADQAVDEVTGRSPSQVVRQTSPLGQPARPDMSYDVKDGIVTDRLNKELFPRR